MYPCRHLFAEVLTVKYKVRYLAAGDACVIVEFGHEISIDLHNRVRGLMQALQNQPMQGIVELVPAYCSLAVHYNPLMMDYQQIVTYLRRLAEKIADIPLPAPREMEMPVVYGGIYGPDLAYVARCLGLSETEVVSMHASARYLVYMLGFTPGFPYLGGMDARLAVPRLENPRVKIPAGSVGIAGGQTGIYPVESPGGWRIIGRTPLALYDAAAEDPVLLRAGDNLRFRPISPEKYEQMVRER